METIILYISIFVMGAVLLVFTVYFNEKIDDKECEYHVVKNRIEDLLKKLERLGANEKFEFKRNAARTKLEGDLLTLSKVQKSFKKMKFVRNVFAVVDFLYLIFAMIIFKAF